MFPTFRTHSSVTALLAVGSIAAGVIGITPPAEAACLSASATFASAIKDGTCTSLVNLDKTITFMGVSTFNDPTAVNDNALVTFIFDPASQFYILGLNFLTGGTTSSVDNSWNYNLSVTSGPGQLIRAGIDVDCNPTDAGCERSLFSSAPTAPNPLTDMALNSVFVPAVSGSDITSSWTFAQGSSANSISDKFQARVPAAPPDSVPGPLPLLGVGAAFGFSRRLRRRLQAKP
jgi:hypothetical protein